MIYLIIIALLLYVFIKNKKSYNKLYEVTSSIDNKAYLIEKTDDELYDIEKADMLAKIQIKIDVLTTSLSRTDERRKILENKPIKLQERDNDKNIGYTINKGDSIGLCIDDDENTLFFIVLHELAHVITKSYGHDDLFWKNFEFLIKESIKLNIYDYKSYNKNPTNYCKKDITYTPHIITKNN